MAEYVVDPRRHHAERIEQRESYDDKEQQDEERGDEGLVPPLLLRQVEIGAPADDVEGHRPQEAGQEHVELPQDEETDHEDDEQKDDLSEAVVELG
jgi:hypothetical protein